MTGIAKLNDQAVVPEKQAQLRKQVAEFEGLLLSNILEKLRDAYHIPGEEQSDSAGESFQSFADSALGKCLAARGGLGVTEMLVQSLTRNQTIQRP